MVTTTHYSRDASTYGNNKPQICLQPIFVWTMYANLEPYKVYRCNKIFSLSNTYGVDRVYIASIHLEGSALEWIKVMKSPSHILGGSLSLKMLSINLIQVNMMMLKDKWLSWSQEYLKQFESLLGHVQCQPKDFFVRYFSTGLQVGIQSSVKMLQPITLK